MDDDDIVHSVEFSFLDNDEHHQSINEMGQGANPSSSTVSASATVLSQSLRRDPSTDPGIGQASEIDPAAATRKYPPPTNPMPGFIASRKRTTSLNQPPTATITAAATAATTATTAMGASDLPINATSTSSPFTLFDTPSPNTNINGQNPSQNQQDSTYGYPPTVMNTSTSTSAAANTNRINSDQQQQASTRYPVFDRASSSERKYPYPMSSPPTTASIHDATLTAEDVYFVDRVKRRFQRFMQSNQVLRTINRRFGMHFVNNVRLIVFLITLGIMSASLIFVVDISVHSLAELREELSIGRTGGGILGLIMYLVTGVGLCLLSTMYCYLWSTEAEGSGIPQMKSVISGFYDKMKPALSIWALAAKCFGLMCAIGGGLPVGWEGPNVHISCIIAHQLSRLQFFRLLRRDRSLRIQIMVCACSVGIASSFGTPIGGVMYALETTGTYYLVPTYWKSYLATLTGAFIYNVLYKTPLVEAFANTHLGGEGDVDTVSRMITYLVLGVVMGLMGAFFVKCVHSMYLFRQRRMPATNRFILVGMVAAVAALIQYPARLFRLDPRYAINELFSADQLTLISWKEVFLLLLVKFPLVCISIGLPIPAGLFIPCFLLGSCIGRLYGEILSAIFGASIVPGGYAVVGAAAFTAGVTRALSCAVIIFEVTGELSHMLPTLFAVLLAVIVGNLLNRPIYDTLLIMKDLPYMPNLRRDRSPSMLAEEVMEQQAVYLQERCSSEDIFKALEKCPKFDSFPVVSNDTGIYLGSVRAVDLENILEQVQELLQSSEDAKTLTANDKDKLDARNGVGRTRTQDDENASSTEGADKSASAASSSIVLTGMNATFAGPKSFLQRAMSIPTGIFRQVQSQSNRARQLIDDDDDNNDDDIAEPSIADTKTFKLSHYDFTLDGTYGFNLNADESPDISNLRSGDESPNDRNIGQQLGENMSASPAIRMRRLTKVSSIDEEEPKLGVADISTPPVAGAGHSQKQHLQDLSSNDGEISPTHGGMMEWDQVPHIVLRPNISGVTVGPNAPVSRVHLLFVMLMPSHILVIHRGRIDGVIRRRDIIQGCHTH